ncbi:MAG: ribbon-helix-helix protein, CopG family [Gemmatimonadetes bacterium]|nr:ribbon-helix-helix protein, CopG family [Gemmatimonadota bacterium]
MAITTIKSTYSLDVDSVRTLEALARRWDVSKSEVIRRALRIALVAGEDADGSVALEALTRLQDTVRERGVDLAQWERELRAERDAAGRRIWVGSE